MASPHTQHTMVGQAQTNTETPQTKGKEEVPSSHWSRSILKPNWTLLTTFLIRADYYSESCSLGSWLHYLRSYFTLLFSIKINQYK